MGKYSRTRGIVATGAARPDPGSTEPPCPALEQPRAEVELRSGPQILSPGLERPNLRFFDPDIRLGRHQQGRRTGALPLARPVEAALVEGVVDPGDRPAGGEAVDRVQFPVAGQ